MVPTAVGLDQERDLWPSTQQQLYACHLHDRPWPGSFTNTTSPPDSSMKALCKQARMSFRDSYAPMLEALGKLPHLTRASTGLRLAEAH